MDVPNLRAVNDDTDLEPVSNFPGTVETEVFIPSLGRTVTVAPGQRNNSTRTLSKAEYRKEAERQKMELSASEAEVPEQNQQAVAKRTPKRGPGPGPGPTAKQRIGQSTRGKPSEATPKSGGSGGNLVQTYGDRLDRLESAISTVVANQVALLERFSTNASAPVTQDLREAVETESGCEEALGGPIDDDDDEDEDDDYVCVKAEEPLPPVLEEVCDLIRRKQNFRVLRQMMVRSLGPLCSTNNWDIDDSSDIQHRFDTLLRDRSFLQNIHRWIASTQKGSIIGSGILYHHIVWLAGASAILMHVSANRT